MLGLQCQLTPKNPDDERAGYMQIDSAWRGQGDVARKPSVIAVTSELPWPLDSGGHLRSYHLLRALASRFDVRLIAPHSSERVGGAVTALRSAGLRPCAVAVAPRTFPSELVKVVGAACRREPYVMFGRHRHSAVRRAIQSAVNGQPPAVVYLDHLDSLSYADILGTSPVVVDMHNVYSRLASRAGSEADGPLRRRYLAAEARLLERMEQRAAAMAHSILAVSSDEARYFRALGAQRVVVVPNGVDCSAYESIAAVPRQGAPTILFVGALGWPPNASAARFLATHVLSAVRARVPDARLIIVGKDPPPEVRALARGDSVTVAANVPDVIPYYREAHILAVPLQAGGGTRLKILEAFAAGVPVVSTAVGCEGLEVVDGRHLVVAERSDFAQAIADLLGAPARAGLLAARARGLALARYDWPIVGALAAEAVQSAADDRESEYRVNNSRKTERPVTLSSIGRL